MGAAMAGTDLNTLARQGWSNQKVTPGKKAALVTPMREPVAKKEAEKPQKPKREMPPKVTYAIEKAIPLPVKFAGPSRLVYPYAALEVGDSFFVPIKTFGISNRIAGRHFVSRPWTQDGKEGRRIWRTK